VIEGGTLPPQYAPHRPWNTPERAPRRLVAFTLAPVSGGRACLCPWCSVRDGSSPFEVDRRTPQPLKRPPPLGTFGFRERLLLRHEGTSFRPIQAVHVPGPTTIVRSHPPTKYTASIGMQEDLRRLQDQASVPDDAGDSPFPLSSAAERIFSGLGKAFSGTPWKRSWTRRKGDDAPFSAKKKGWSPLVVAVNTP